MGNWNWFSKSGYNSSSTAEQVTEGIDATGLTAIVTGATNGIGKETARVLALRGVKVIILSRDLKNGFKTKEMILQENPKAKIEVMEMDLTSIESITSFAQSFNSSEQDLNLLISQKQKDFNIASTFLSRNNAGIFACPYQLSEDGIEMHFATNHLGHFLLTKLLMDRLKTTAKKTGVEGRIINVSSLAHVRNIKEDSLLDLEIINNPAKYEKCAAYSRSKLANILHANELARVLQAEEANVTANSLHPGFIPTNIFQFLSFRVADIPLLVLAALWKPFLKNIPQGASTTCYLALHPDLKGVTGKYFSDCKEIPTSIQAQDKDLGNKLWDFTMDLLDNLHKPK